jgi:hypothetical protein
LSKQLENEIGTNIHFGLDLSNFAQEVWGLDKEAVEKALAMPITLHGSEAEAFRLGEGSADDGVQRAFVAISSRLLNEAAKELGGEDNGSFTDTFASARTPPADLGEVCRTSSIPGSPFFPTVPL